MSEILSEDMRLKCLNLVQALYKATLDGRIRWRHVDPKPSVLAKVSDYAIVVDPAHLELFIFDNNAQEVILFRARKGVERNTMSELTKLLYRDADAKERVLVDLLASLRS